MARALNYTEEQLIALLKEGSRDGFNYVYEAYGTALYHAILRLIPQEETAQDVLQESFVKIWRNVAQYDSGKGRLYTWMLNISRHAAIDRLRSRGEVMKAKIQGDDSLVNNVSRNAGMDPQTDTIGLQNLVAGLRPEYRRIVDLAYFQGYTLAEISQSLDVPLGTVKTRMRAAMLQLREQFKEQR